MPALLEGKVYVRPRKRRGFGRREKHYNINDSGWLGREDSNLRMAESKSAALPLGYTPIAQRINRLRRLRNSRSTRRCRNLLILLVSAMGLEPMTL
jgi:hypothetical protein